MFRLVYLAAGMAIALGFGAAVAGAEEDESMDTRTYTLGVLFFEGFELLDAMGPLEMLGNVGPGLKIVTVAEEAGEVASAQQIKTVAEYGFEDCPELDILLVPGGFGAMKFVMDESKLAWVRDRGEAAEIAASVCNGSQILAHAGLLDGRKATTNKAYYKMITGQREQVDWQAKARWVDDGDRVTSSGVSAGIDMSLHLIARLFGDERAVKIAELTEYDWHRDPSWDPFAELHGLAKEE